MSDCPVRVLVVDDSVLFRKIVRDVLAKIDDVEVIGVARDGIDALQKIERLAPDLITLDVEMPQLDGLGVLAEMKHRGLKSRAVMLSAVTQQGADATMQALDMGAFDFIVKPNGSSAAENVQTLQTALTQKIAALRSSFRLRHLTASRNSDLSSVSRPQDSDHSGVVTSAFQNGPRPAQDSGFASEKRRRGDYAAVVIGVSTGGPDALRQFLPEVPGSFPIPILVVQHMPPLFTKSLADSLNARCQLEVAEATHHQVVEPGRILIAPGGKHMRVAQSGPSVRVQLTDDPPEHSCRPAVDYLFRSAVRVYGAGTLGMIMTGMGCDGAEGCRLIKKTGGSVIAQDEDSCVVFGMPRLPVAEGVADSIVPLERLAQELQSFVGGGVTVCP